MKVISNLILDFNSDDYINMNNKYDKYSFKRLKKLWENLYYYFRICGRNRDRYDQASNNRKNSQYPPYSYSQI